MQYTMSLGLTTAQLGQTADSHGKIYICQAEQKKT